MAAKCSESDDEDRKKITEAGKRLKEARKKRLKEKRNADGAGFNNKKEQDGAMASARKEGRLDDY